MKKLVVLLSGLALAASVSAAPVSLAAAPTDLGVNITTSSNFLPGANALQEYDLEAFYFDKATNSLSMQSGFSVDALHKDWNTKIHAYDYITLGDIFIETDATSDGYDYAVMFNRNTKNFADYTYSIVDLKAGYEDVGLLDRYDGGSGDCDHNAALPFAVKTFVSGVVVGSGTFTYETYTDADGIHYVMSDINLGNDIGGSSFAVHQTMGCGNSVVNGSVPEPAMVSLLGFGLLGLAIFRRRK